MAFKETTPEIRCGECARIFDIEYGSDKHMEGYHTREQTVVILSALEDVYLQCDIVEKHAKVNVTYQTAWQSNTEKTEMLGPVHKMRMEI